MLPIHLDNHLGPMRPINLLSRDSRRLGVTWVHPERSLFEARNEFPVTKGELKRVTMHGRVEGRAIIEPTGIVDLDCIPGFCLDHAWSPTERSKHPR
jgi:hypothetical protein